MDAILPAFRRDSTLMFKKPSLSDVHFAVLAIIGDDTVSGADIRRQLEFRINHKTSHASFYTMMATLEDEKNFVTGRFESITVKGHVVREKRYSITEDGRHAFAATLNYYTELAKLPNSLAFGF